MPLIPPHPHPHSTAQPKPAGCLLNAARPRKAARVPASQRGQSLALATLMWMALLGGPPSPRGGVRAQPNQRHGARPTNAAADGCRNRTLALRPARNPGLAVLRHQTAPRTLHALLAAPAPHHNRTRYPPPSPRQPAAPPAANSRKAARGPASSRGSHWPTHVLMADGAAERDTRPEGARARLTGPAPRRLADTRRRLLLPACGALPQCRSADGRRR
jgi:hypothetical protein